MDSKLTMLGNVRNKRRNLNKYDKKKVKKLVEKALPNKEIYSTISIV